MSSITTKLAELLSTVRRPGDFYVSGTIELLAPRLHVEGVGQIALPLLPMQATQLVAVAERAPYGRGAQTVLDTEVRRTWQIAADQVKIGGKHWAGTLETILAKVAEGLGITEPIVERRPHSYWRQTRMRMLLEERATIAVGDLEAALRDHTTYPDSICRHENPEDPPEEWCITVTSAIMDLDARTLRLTDGPPCEHPYRVVSGQWSVVSS